MSELQTYLAKNGISRSKFVLRSLQKLSQGPTAELRAQMLSLRKGPWRSGTTIVAIHYDGGVLIAGDRRVTDMFTHDDEAIKVGVVEPLSLFGTSGLVSYGQELLDVFEDAIEMFQRLIGRPIYIDGQAEILKNILRENAKELAALGLMLDYIAIPILAGWDPEDEKGKIFHFDESGGIYETGTIGAVTIGSGGDYARVILEEQWRKGMSLREAVWLVIRAIFRAAGIDLFTAPPQQHPVTVYSVSAKGFSQIETVEALRIARKIEREDFSRRKDKTNLAFLKKGGR